jgi:hypothetical protein
MTRAPSRRRSALTGPFSLVTIASRRRPSPRTGDRRGGLGHAIDLYTFTVESFSINDTRALHNDTLSLGYSVYVDGDLVSNLVIPLGDFDNGNYNTADYTPAGVGPGLANVVINNPNAKSAFVFQLVNAGNVPAGALTGRIAATADQLAGITSVATRGWQQLHS